MNLLLINPVWSNKIHLPVNLAELAGYVREKSSHRVNILDLNTHFITSPFDPKDYIKESIHLISLYNTDIIGITCNTIHVPFVIELITRLKQENKIPLIVGGIHATFKPELFLGDKKGDFVIRGEGELTLVELLNCLELGTSLTRIQGLSFFQHGKIIHNNNRPLINDLSILPFPAYDLIRPPKNLPFQLAPSATRGCPYGCVFCATTHFWGYQRQKPIHRIITEIKILKKEFLVNHVGFADDCLSLNKSWFEEFLQEIKKLNISWSCLTRLDSLNTELIKKMSAAGCTLIYFGIESGSQRLRKLLEKRNKYGITNRKIIQLISTALREHICITASFISGIPTETQKDMDQTRQLILLLHHLGAKTQYWLMTPYIGTKATSKYTRFCKPFDKWEKIRQSDIFSSEQQYLFYPYLEKYHIVNPDRFIFKTAMPLKKFLKHYQDTRKTLGLQTTINNNFTPPLENKLFFQLKEAKQCQKCNLLFNISENNRVSFCNKQETTKSFNLQRTEDIFIAFLKSLYSSQNNPACAPNKKEIIKILKKITKLIILRDLFFSKVINKQYVSAIDIGNKLIKYKNIDPKILYIQAICYQEIKKYRLACNLLKKIINQYPHAATALAFNKDMTIKKTTH